MGDLQHSQAKRLAMLTGLAGHHGREGFSMQHAAEHGLPSELLRGDLKELVSAGKLVERVDFKGEPRWAKDVTFKAFGETRTNAQLMAWRQQMLNEYGVLDFKLNKPETGPGTRVKAPWARAVSPRPPVKKRKMPRAVVLFLHKMLQVAEQRKGANGGTLHNFLRRVFMSMDKDSSGKLTRSEFHHAARSTLGMRLSSAEEEVIFSYFDTDHGGSISWQELFDEVKILEALKVPWPNARQSDVEMCSARRRLGRRPNAVVQRFRKLLIQSVQRRSKLHGLSVEKSIASLFDGFDEDGSGLLSVEELVEASRVHLGWHNMTAADASHIVAWYDIQGRGGASRAAILAEAKDPSCSFTGLQAPVWFWTPKTKRQPIIGDLHLRSLDVPPGKIGARVSARSTRTATARSARSGCTARSARSVSSARSASSRDVILNAARPRTAVMTGQPPEKRALDTAIASAQQMTKATARPMTMQSSGRSRSASSRRAALEAAGVLTSRSQRPEIAVDGSSQVSQRSCASSVSSARRRHLLAEKLRVENELLRIKIRAREMEIEASEGTRTGGRR